MNELWQKNLVPYTRVTALERDKDRLEGERGQLIATTAQTKGKITETELQILQIDQCAARSARGLGDSSSFLACRSSASFKLAYEPSCPTWSSH